MATTKRVYELDGKEIAEAFAAYLVKKKLAPIGNVIVNYDVKRRMFSGEVYAVVEIVEKA